MVLRARTQAGNLASCPEDAARRMTDEAYRLESRGEVETASVILQQSQRMQRQSITRLHARAPRLRVPYRASSPPSRRL